MIFLGILLAAINMRNENKKRFLARWIKHRKDAILSRVNMRVFLSVRLKDRPASVPKAMTLLCAARVYFNFWSRSSLWAPKGHCCIPTCFPKSLHRNFSLEILMACGTDYVTWWIWIKKRTYTHTALLLSSRKNVPTRYYTLRSVLFVYYTVCVERSNLHTKQRTL